MNVKNLCVPLFHDDRRSEAVHSKHMFHRRKVPLGLYHARIDRSMRVSDLSAAVSVMFPFR